MLEKIQPAIWIFAKSPAFSVIGIVLSVRPVQKEIGRAKALYYIFDNLSV